MTESARKRYERKLRRERAQAQQLLAATPVDRETDFSTTDRADLATIAAEREMDCIVSTLESEAVHEIDSALARLELSPETFGKCVTCGCEIPRERLDILPATRHCAAHASER